MKKIALLVVGLMAIAGLHAQTGIHLGFGGAPLNTWILNQDDSDAPADTFSYNFTLGYAGMVKVGYNFGPPFGLHLGFLYSKQGQKSETIEEIDSTGAKRTVLVNRDLRYFKLPLLLHFNSKPNDVMFRMELGPQLGFLYDANYLRDQTAAQSVPDANLLFEKTDISFMWAIGAEIRLGDHANFFIEHRGDISVADIENKAVTFNGIPFFPNDRDAAQNLTLGLFVGFEFCFLPSGGGRNTKFWFR